jgi:hypothetical protein
LLDEDAPPVRPVIQAAVFNELKNALEKYRNREDPRDNVVVIGTHPYHTMHVSGYKKTIDRIVGQVMYQHKPDYDYEVIPENGSRRFVTVIIQHRVPVSAHARFKGEKAFFIDGPFRGEMITWSKRAGKVYIRKRNDTFEVRPDIWNGSFYGWLEKKR